VKRPGKDNGPPTKGGNIVVSEMVTETYPHKKGGYKEGKSD